MHTSVVVNSFNLLNGQARKSGYQGHERDSKVTKKRECKTSSGLADSLQANDGLPYGALKLQRSVRE
jgi:hypothetical protein